MSTKSTPSAASPTDAGGLADCDLVMKGGITSGVVYPKLIARLARQYRFRSIGGTSAGAIAAAACAAAELARRKQANTTAFAELAKLPEALGTSVGQPAASMLFHLFQPAAAVRGHFAVLVGALNAPSPLAAAGGALRAMLLTFWPGALLALAIALLLLAPAVRALAALAWPSSIGWAVGLLLAWLVLMVAPARRLGLRGLLGGIAVAWLVTLLVVWCGAPAPLVGAALLALVCAVAVPLAVALAVLLAGTRFAVTLLRGLHGNFYGLCSGRTAEPERGASGLTDWLTGYLNGLAGMDPPGRPGR